MIQAPEQNDPSASTLSLIGAGRVACSLGRWFHCRADVDILDVLSRGPDAAHEAVERLGTGRAVASLDQIRPVDFLMIAVPDSSIPDVVGQLAVRGADLSSTCVFHTSGMFGVEVLQPLSSRAGTLAAVHPLRAFSDADTPPDALDDMLCIASGNDQALQRLQPLFHHARLRSAGGIDRHLYHAGAVILSNHLRALAAAGESVLASAGLDASLAREVRDTLLEDGVDGMQGGHALEGITGPLQRGDRATLEAQIKALASYPGIQNAYRALSLVLLEALRERTASQTGDSDYQTMLQALSDPK